MEVLDTTRTREIQLMTRFAGAMLDRGMTPSEVRDRTKRLLRHYRGASLRNAIVYGQDDRVESQPIFNIARAEEVVPHRNPKFWRAASRIPSLVVRDVIGSVQFLSTPQFGSAVIRRAFFLGGIVGSYALSQPIDNSVWEIAKNIGMGYFEAVAVLGTATEVASRVRTSINNKTRQSLLNA